MQVVGDKAEGGGEGRLGSAVVWGCSGTRGEKTRIVRQIMKVIQHCKFQSS